VLKRRSIKRHVSRLLPVALAASLAGCVAETPSPAPQARPAPPVQRPRPAPSPTPPEWQDLPITAGGWSYQELPGGNAQAAFGAGQTSFVVACDHGSGTISLSRQGIATGNVMTVRTSSTARNLPLSVGEGAQSVSATLPAQDSFLDDIAFSRGRFTVMVPGTALLVIPSWPEPARVIEDCRGQ